MSETLSMLGGRWKGLCRVIFGTEIGELRDYAKYLTENNEPIGHRKSNISGKEVVSAPTAYYEGAKWIAHDEVDFSKRFEPLSINEIKDIDSVVEALGERACYTGNIFFGQSGNIENSSNINDSFCIYETAFFGNSKYLAYCTVGRRNEACFGCNAVVESEGCIKCCRSFRNKRSFELWMSQNSTDCYYSFGLENCLNCMFCFNAQNKRNAIGNLELGREKYNAIKEKLASEMASELVSRHNLPSLLDLVEQTDEPNAKKEVAKNDTLASRNIAAIETSFAHTTGVLFGEKLDGIETYANWLKKHTRPVGRGVSAASGKPLVLANYANYQKFPRGRLVDSAEAREKGAKTHLEASEVETMNMQNAGQKLKKLAFFNVEFFEGSNMNLAECAIAVDSTNCYRSSLLEYSKNCAYSFWTNNCQNVFGSDGPFDSNSCINIYYCCAQTRCFEIDCCGYCSDTYFAHGCENLSEAMFCFNVKNKRFAIGNAEMQPEKYRNIKAALLGQIAEELEEKKDLKWGIYNIGCRVKGQK